MQRHGFILALLLGAGGLLVVFGSFLLLEFRSLIAPYAGLEGQETVVVASARAPRLVALAKDTNITIVELNKESQVARTIYTSSLTDELADFVLFAVPQEHYTGRAYVRSLQDAERNLLVLYPLDVINGKLGPWVINATSDFSTLSENEERIAVIEAQGVSQRITLYDITTGSAVTSWTLGPNEWLSADPYSAASGYSGGGVRWISPTCFEHPVWLGSARFNEPLTQIDLRTFCSDPV